MKRILLILSLVLVMTSCGGNQKQNENADNVEQTVVADTAQAETTELLFFHGKQRCVTCTAIEDLTRQIVDSIGRKDLVLKVIDISKDENKELADKYEVSWSALILEKGDKKEDLTEMAYGYANSKPEVFKKELINAINSIDQ